MSRDNTSSLPRNCLAIAALALGSLAILCNATCIENRMRRDRAQPQPEVCINGSEERPINSTWITEDCMNCTCTLTGITCCSVSLMPIAYEEACKVTFNKTSCTYDVRRTDNGTKECLLAYM
ncbi:beta-microseminoprotein-like [Spea bombifrons]|uniref:beta-microseminoprotein-like n=1 Tax=Spea bombifrons TaxID=233779 RepID=UPI00234A1120|nr:beta-microseminoprotein-like [Spea bombifrons]